MSPIITSMRGNMEAPRVVGISKVRYDVTLDAIGFYVEQRGGSDLLAVELEGGFALTYVVGAVQSYVALDNDELRELSLEATKRSRAKRGQLRGRLRSIGYYFEERNAASVVVQERASGYSVEFTGFENDKDDRYDIPQLRRIHEELSHKFVQALPSKF